MELQTWLLYFAACLGLSLSPGPNGLLALTHGALYGSRKALFTISGGAIGFTLLMAASMFGIGALLQASLVWLTILKWVGGAYLVFLGIQLWLSPPLSLHASEAAASRPGAALFREGFLSAVTNPKVILFFAAFLPQFIDPNGNLWLQFAIMAATFGVTEFFYEWMIAGAAHRIRPWLQRVGRRFNQACGGIFIAIGVAMPLRG